MKKLILTLISSLLLIYVSAFAADSKPTYDGPGSKTQDTKAINEATDPTKPCDICELYTDKSTINSATKDGYQRVMPEEQRADVSPGKTGTGSDAKPGG